MVSWVDSPGGGGGGVSMLVLASKLVLTLCTNITCVLHSIYGKPSVALSTTHSQTKQTLKYVFYVIFPFSGKNNLIRMFSRIYLAHKCANLWPPIKALFPR